MDIQIVTFWSFILNNKYASDMPIIARYMLQQERLIFIHLEIESELNSAWECQPL